MSQFANSSANEELPENEEMQHQGCGSMMVWPSEGRLDFEGLFWHEEEEY